MRVSCLASDPSLYERQIGWLAEMGHEVHLALTAGQVFPPPAALRRLGVAHPRLTISNAPSLQGDVWDPLMRSVANRFETGRVDGGRTSRLLRRAATAAGQRWVLPWLERAVGVERPAGRYLLEQRPDVVVIDGVTREGLVLARAAGHHRIPVIRFDALETDGLARLERVKPRRPIAPSWAATCVRAILRPAAHRHAPARVHRLARKMRKYDDIAARSAAPVQAAARSAARGHEPVIVGPFLSEVGHEVLYWIPALRRLLLDEPGLRGRMVVVSRGGVSSWYRGIGDRYLDLYELMRVEEVLALRERIRAARGGSQKQKGVAVEESPFIDAVRERLGANRVSLLHPGSLLPEVHRAVWRGPIDLGRRPFAYAPLEGPRDEEVGGAVGRLPARFVAVRLYSSGALPLHPALAEFASTVVERVARHCPVVVLDPVSTGDAHRTFSIPESPGVTVVRITDPATNLATQTAVLARADAFVGTYGGLSYLASALGVPTVALVGNPARVRPWHLAMAMRAAREPGFGNYLALDVSSCTTGDVDDVVRAVETRVR